ncbi:MAG: SDR family NAD(P)-dependent oxidoreductase, partial [Mycobacteriaceae bacterium]
MRVLVTGGTGFVGAWTARAIAEAGHEVRFLVRDPVRLASSAGAIGVDVSAHVTGDITDAPSVQTALDGCDAVVHCAAMVATDPRKADEMLATNVAGARNVLGAAVEAGLDPIVHVSSMTALFSAGLKTMHADLEVTGGRDGYGRSKAAVDRYARDLQRDGAPVVITYPGMVLGPGAGVQFGEVAEGVETILKSRLVPGIDAGWVVIDVRDLAAIHAALIRPEMGGRRFMAGGTYVGAGELRSLLQLATGHRISQLPVPGSILRALGSGIDLATKHTPFVPVLTRAAMDYYTRMPASDDGPVRDDLGVAYRPLIDTFN